MTAPTGASAFARAAERVRAGGDHHTEASALVAAMTLDEQLGCLDGDTPFWEGTVSYTHLTLPTIYSV